jgi:hypothetical protein
VRRIAVVLLLIQTGCYSYRSGSDVPLNQGTAVRAYLSTPRDFRLTDISVNNTTLVDGEVIRQAPDTLVVSAFGLRAETGYSVPGVGETLAIPNDIILRVEQKKLDPIRTGLLVGAAAAASVLLFATLDLGNLGGSGSDGKPVPQ